MQDERFFDHGMDDFGRRKSPRGGTLFGSSAVAAPKREVFERLDRVKLGNGHVMIVTEYNPHKPANCYTGVLENGTGKQYVFGPKHRPVKLGTVNEGHPALLNLATRAGVEADAPSKPVVSALLKAMDDGDAAAVKTLTGVLRGMGY